jgi:phosphoserine phosphatase
MLLEHFRPQLFQDILDKPDTEPDSLRTACFAFAQHRRYLEIETRRTLDKALMSSQLRHQKEIASIWVDAVFHAIGPSGKDCLSAFEIDAKGPGAARELAGMRLGALKNESSLPLKGSQEGTRQWELLRSGQTMAPEDLIAKLKVVSGTIREDARTHGYAHVVAPDCDGTLWYGDIGDLFFERALTQRWLKKPCAGVLHDLCDRYGIKVYPNVNDTARSMMDSKDSGAFLKSATQLGVGKNDAYRQFYATQGLCMGGLSVGFIKARAYEIMNESGGLKNLIFPQVEALLRKLSDLGMVILPISASLNFLVEIGVTFLGIPGRLAMGVTTPHSQGIVTPKLIEPMPYGLGKITLISQFGGLPPAIALGDSWERTDKELLLGAGLGLVITHGKRPASMPEELICLEIEKPITS